MKLIATLVLLFSSTVVFADGVPQGPSSRTPYIWDCEDGVTFYLEKFAGVPTAFIESSGGGIGVEVSPRIAQMLTYKAYVPLNQMRHRDARFNRLISFELDRTSGTSKLSVQIQEAVGQPTVAKACVAQF